MQTINQYGQLQIGNQYPAYNNNQQGYQHITTNQINNIKDDSSSRDKYYNNHVACIAVGNKQFKEKYEQRAKEKNKTLDELVGTDFLFGKYLNFEANNEEWEAQLKDLKRQLSDKNLKFANLKGIKFFLDEHGVEGNDRNLVGSLEAKPLYYKSKRFQQVAEIINDCFLNKNQDNKLYFVNMACYGAYFANELKKNVDNDVPRSNNIYEILSNAFRLNIDKVYCSQLIPQSSMHATDTLNSSCNPYRNRISYSTQIGKIPRGGECYKYYNNRGPHDFRKKYYLEYSKLFVNEDLIPSPKCRIYFPLKEFRGVVPNDLCLKPNGPKEYRVDSKIFENYTGKTAKDKKNDFLKWGDKPKHVHFDENKLFTDPLGNQFDNLQQCVNAWNKAYKEVKMEETKKINQQKQLQKNYYYKKKMREKDDCCIAF